MDRLKMTDSVCFRKPTNALQQIVNPHLETWRNNKFFSGHIDGRKAIGSCYALFCNVSLMKI